MDKLSASKLESLRTLKSALFCDLSQKERKNSIFAGGGGPFIQKHQLRGKFVFRQLVANFTDFQWNNSAFMKKHKQQQQKNPSFKKCHSQGKFVSTFSGTK